MTMSDDRDSFFSRWSRRKAQVQQGHRPPDSEPSSAAEAAREALPVESAAVPERPVQAVPSVQAPPSPPPTIEDVQGLTPESDFSRFVARDVDPQVKNLAMKKLFSDPHFNVMDGLDTYIDDYNTPDPLPKSLLRQLVQARSLGLLDDEMPEQPVPHEVEVAPGPGQGEAAEPIAQDDAAAVVPAAPEAPPMTEELPRAASLAEAPAAGQPADGSSSRES